MANCRNKVHSKVQCGVNKLRRNTYPSFFCIFLYLSISIFSAISISPSPSPLSSLPFSHSLFSSVFQKTKIIQKGEAQRTICFILLTDTELAYRYLFCFPWRKPKCIEIKDDGKICLSPRPILIMASFLPALVLITDFL
jgi:hypothetical protein